MPDRLAPPVRARSRVSAWPAIVGLQLHPALLDAVGAEKRRHTELILDHILPIGRKSRGLRNDGFRAGTLFPTDYERVAFDRARPEPDQMTCARRRAAGTPLA
jgi:hypothetical protein